MKKIYSLLLSVVMFAAVSCTAANMGVTIGYTPNTNPAKEYSVGYGGYLKGGGLIHMNSSMGQVANASFQKGGEGCSRSILGLIAWGDSSIENAKSSGEIKKVASIEYKTFAILGWLYHHQCTVVTGE